MHREYGRDSVFVTRRGQAPVHLHFYTVPLGGSGRLLSGRTSGENGSLFAFAADRVATGDSINAALYLRKTDCETAKNGLRKNSHLRLTLQSGAGTIG